MKKAAPKPADKTPRDFEIPPALSSGEAWVTDTPIVIENHAPANFPTGHRSIKDILNETLVQLGITDSGVEWFESNGYYILAKPLAKIQM